MCVLWIFLVHKYDATHFMLLLLHIHAHAYMHPYPNIPHQFWGVYSLGCETPQFILCTLLYKIVGFVFLLCSIKGLKLSFFLKPCCCKMTNEWAFSLYIMQMKASKVHETCVAPQSSWCTSRFDIKIFAYLQNLPRTADLASYWKPSPCNIKKKH